MTSTALFPFLGFWRTLASAPRDGTPIFVTQPRDAHFGGRYFAVVVWQERDLLAEYAGAPPSPPGWLAHFGPSVSVLFGQGAFDAWCPVAKSATVL